MLNIFHIMIFFYAVETWLHITFHTYLEKFLYIHVITWESQEVLKHGRDMKTPVC